MAKLTEEELRKIIQEELEDIDENIFDRFLARAKGSASGVGAGLKNIGRGAKQIYKGQELKGLADTAKVKKYTTAKNIIKQHEKKITPLITDMIKDIVVLRKDRDPSDPTGETGVFDNVQAFKDASRKAYSLKGTLTKIMKELDRNLENMKKNPTKKPEGEEEQ
jgi:hypothetical protein